MALSKERRDIHRLQRMSVRWICAELRLHALDLLFNRSGDILPMLLAQKLRISRHDQEIAGMLPTQRFPHDLCAMLHESTGGGEIAALPVGITEKE